MVDSIAMADKNDNLLRYILKNKVISNDVLETLLISSLGFNFRKLRPTDCREIIIDD